VGKKSNPKILLIDDEKVILDTISYFLRSKGFEVVESTSAFDALKELEKDSFSVIISDEKMPGLSGLDLFRKTKELYPNTVRILMSGYADLEMARAAIADGEVYRFICKPFDMEDFLLCVKQAIKHNELLKENQNLLKELMDWNRRLEQEVEARTKELKESEEKYRTLFEKANEGIILIDHMKENKIIDCNEAFALMTGYDRVDLIGKDFWDLQDKMRYHRGKKGFKQKLEAGIGGSIHLNLLRKDGVSITIQFLSSEIEHRERMILNGFCLDITERIKIEQDLYRAHQIIEEKTNEMEEFIYIASHEIQTPIVPIYGYAKLLLEFYGERLDSQAIGWLEVIRNNSLIVKRLVNELLDLARIRTTLNPFQMIDTGTLLKSIFKSYEDQMIRRGIKKEIQEDLPSIYGDPLKVKIVFNNLINNAIKYLEKSKDPMIKILCQREDAFHRFSIIDTGCGIKEEDCRKIFKPMWRLPERKGEGTGLGLYLVKKIMEIHGGDIWVESELGKGSTFFVSFPRIVDDDRKP